MVQEGLKIPGGLESPYFPRLCAQCADCWHCSWSVYFSAEWLLVMLWLMPRLHLAVLTTRNETWSLWKQLS